MARGESEGSDVEVDTSTWSRRGGVPLASAVGSPSTSSVHHQEVVLRKVGEIRDDFMGWIRTLGKKGRRRGHRVGRGDEGVDDGLGEDSAHENSTPSWIYTEGPMVAGESSERVRTLQRYLVKEGLLSSKRATGTFDADTVEAVGRWHAGEAGRQAPDGPVPDEEWENGEPERAEVHRDHEASPGDALKSADGVEVEEGAPWSVADFVTMAKEQRDRMLAGMQRQMQRREHARGMGEGGDRSEGGTPDEGAWTSAADIASMAVVQRDRALQRDKEEAERRRSGGKRFAEMAKVQQGRVEAQEREERGLGRKFAEMLKAQKARKMEEEKARREEEASIAAWLADGAKVQAQRASDGGPEHKDKKVGEEVDLSPLGKLKQKLSKGRRSLLDPNVRTSPAMIIGACATSATMALLLGKQRERMARRARMRELGLIEEGEEGWDSPPRRGSPPRPDDQGYPWRRTPSSGGYSSDGTSAISDGLVMSAQKSSMKVLRNMDNDSMEEEVAVSAMAVLGTEAALKVFLVVSEDLEETEDEAMEAGRDAVQRAAVHETNLLDEDTLGRCLDVANIAVSMSMGQVKGHKAALLLAQCTGRTPKFVLDSVEEGMALALKKLSTGDALKAAVMKNATGDSSGDGPALEGATVAGQKKGVDVLIAKVGRNVAEDDLQFAQLAVETGVRAGVHALKAIEGLVDTEEGASLEDIANRAGQWAAEKLYENNAAKLGGEARADAQRQLQRIGIFAAETFVRQFYKAREEARLNGAASCIQRVARKRLDGKNQAATKIQAVHRGNTVRKAQIKSRQKQLELEAEARRREEEARKEQAAEQQRAPDAGGCGCMG